MKSIKRIECQNIQCINHSLFPIYSVSHDVVEVITGNESIIIKISFSEHLVDFIVLNNGLYLISSAC